VITKDEIEGKSDEFDNMSDDLFGEVISTYFGA
jgi:hypothetical protein